MTAAVDPPGWVLRLHRRAARRGDRCRRCGHRRVVDTGQGPYCRPHADALPPPILTRHDNDENDHDVRPAT